MPEEQRRYKALAHIIVGGRLLYPKDREFKTGVQYGSALVKEGKAVEIPGRYKRRDMRAEGDDG